MRLSYQWLGDFVENLPDADEVARRLTAGGIEVEAVERPERDYGDRLAVARILSMELHPNADRLSVCQVDDGGDSPLTIVCGARNMKAGDTVVVARIGCELPGGMQIRKSKLRGVESEGMLCAAGELGLEASGEGILILEDGLVVGTPAASLLGLDDTILELGVTPNRGDCLSIFGLAREVAALTGLALRSQPTTLVRPEGNCAVDVSIEDPQACLLYHGLILRGVKVGPSPTWLRTRLGSCGLRSINNVVDVTNLVLMERGQPLHAFDLSRLAGSRVVVRRARAGESLRTLDGADVTLREEDLVIADAAAPVALAGVMGGEASAVENSTTDVFLESALFDPATVRRTSRRHGLITDSSYRFERGVDWAGVESALLRAASLLVEVAGATLDGGLQKAGAGPRLPEPILVREQRVNAILGQAYSGERIEAVLRGIGAQPTPVAEGFRVRPPSHRQDLDREIDFVEEVARVVGYDSIEPAMPLAALTPVAVPVAVQAANSLRSLLSGLGLYEHVFVSFASDEDNTRFPGFFGDVASVPVRNPLRSDATALQKSALGALISALRLNISAQQKRVDLFTIARTFGWVNGAPSQREIVAGVLYGPRPMGRPGETQALAFPDLKAIVEKVLGLLAAGATWEYVATSGRPEFHPRACAAIRVGGRDVGFLGRLHPDVTEGSEITGETYVFEVDCRGAVEYRRAHSGLQPIARFPGSERDVSLLVDLEVPAGAALQSIDELDDACIESIEVFDDYRGVGIDQGRKALGYRLVYRAADRTLTEAEVTALHERVVGHLTERLGARVRV